MSPNRAFKFGLPFASALAGVMLLQSAPSTAATIYDKDGTSFSVFGSISATLANGKGYYALSEANYDAAHDANNKATIYSKAEIGLAGRSTIVHGADAIMMALWETQLNEHDDGGFLHTKYMFAGVDAYQYGTLVVGRGDTAFYTVAGATDIFELYDSKASEYFIYGDQRPSQVMYSLRGLSWDLKLSYLFANFEQGDTPVAAHSGYAASVSTKFGENITFAYGLDYTKFETNRDVAGMNDFFSPMFAKDKNLSPSEASAYASDHMINHKLDYGVALSYGTFGKGFYGAIALASTNYAYLGHHLYSVDTALNYTFDNGFSTSLGYGYKTYEGLTIVSDFTLGISYSPSPAFKVYAEAQLDAGGHADEFYSKTYLDKTFLNEDKLGVGLKYSF